MFQCYPVHVPLKVIDKLKLSFAISCQIVWLAPSFQYVRKSIYAFLRSRWFFLFVLVNTWTIWPTASLNISNHLTILMDFVLIKNDTETQTIRICFVSICNLFGGLSVATYKQIILLAVGNHRAWFILPGLKWAKLALQLPLPIAIDK